MFSHHHTHHEFLSSAKISPLYISIFLLSIAESLIGLFIPIYLASLGYPVVKIISFFLVGNIGSVLLALPIGKLVAERGIKLAILISTPFLLLYYGGLHFLANYPWLFFMLPPCIAVRSLLYNFGFGMHFIEHANRKKIGSAISFLQIFAIISTTIAPIVSGHLVTHTSYAVLFATGCLFLTLSFIPLAYTNETKNHFTFDTKTVLRSFLIPERRRLEVSFVGYAIESIISRVIWPLFLILIVGSIVRVGWIMSLATLITVLMLYFVGKLTDRYRGTKLLRIGTFFYFLGWLTSAFADNPFKLFCIEIYRKISERCIIVPWSAAFYRSLPKQHYFEYVVAQDMIYNLSRILVLPLIIVIFLINFHPFTFSFITASLFTLLYPLAQPKTKAKMLEKK